MIMRNRVWIGLAVAIVVVLAPTAMGQVVQTQSGRALDSNFRVGSGGYNARAAVPPALDSQRLITGQVTGLGAFRGRVGYVASDELRLTLPSARLGTFEKQSVGVDNAVSGPTYRPELYLNRSSTVLGSRGISEGLTAPGTSVPRASLPASLVGRKEITDALADFKKTGTRKVGEELDSTIKPLPIPVTYRNDPGDIRELSGAMIGRKATVSPFDIRKPPEENLQLIEELRRHKDPEDADEQKEQESKRIGGRIDTRQQKTELTPPGQEPEDSTVAVPSGLGQKPQEERGVDVFRDVVSVLQSQYLTGLTQEQQKQAQEAPLPSWQAMSTESLAVEESGEMEVRSFAGVSKDEFTLTLKAAESQLKKGKYYTAAALFSKARVLNPGNSLVNLGISEAYFLAGEPVTAAQSLLDGMRSFPALMVIRLHMGDIPQDHLQAELKSLYGRIESDEEKQDVRLLFLSAYVFHSMGDKAKAQFSARKLLKAAGEDEIYRMYALYILTGKRPSAQ